MGLQKGWKSVENCNEFSSQKNSVNGSTPPTPSHPNREIKARLFHLLLSLLCLIKTTFSSDVISHRRSHQYMRDVAEFSACHARGFRRAFVYFLSIFTDFQLVSSVRPLMFAWFPWSPQWAVFSVLIFHSCKWTAKNNMRSWEKKKKHFISYKRVKF